MGPDGANFSTTVQVSVNTETLRGTGTVTVEKGGLVRVEGVLRGVRDITMGTEVWKTD